MIPKIIEIDSELAEWYKATSVTKRIEHPVFQKFVLIEKFRKCINSWLLYVCTCAHTIKTSNNDEMKIRKYYMLRVTCTSYMLTLGPICEVSGRGVNGDS